jgi:hypothetical protein
MKATLLAIALTVAAFAAGAAPSAAATVRLAAAPDGMARPNPRIHAAYRGGAYRPGAAQQPNPKVNWGLRSWRRPNPRVSWGTRVAQNPRINWGRAIA